MKLGPELRTILIYLKMDFHSKSNIKIFIYTS